MKIYLILTGIFIFILLSCNESKKSKVENKVFIREISTTYEEDINLSDLLTNKPENNSLIEFVDTDCVCFVQMTSEESDSLEAVNPELYEIHSEKLNNESTRVYELLENLKIKNIWTDKRIICFRSSGNEIYINTRKKNLFTKCLIYSSKNGLQIIDSESIDETTINKYL